MISPTNPANRNQNSAQDPGKHFHDLLANLANHNKDLAFFKYKCLNILTHQVDWPVDDLIGYLEDLQTENILTPKALQELHAQEIFQDSEHLMEKYSILLEALDEARSSEARRLLWPYQVAISQYAMYFKEDPSERVAIGIEQLVWKRYTLADASRDMSHYLQHGTLPHCTYFAT